MSQSGSHMYWAAAKSSEENAAFSDSIWGRWRVTYGQVGRAPVCSDRVVKTNGEGRILWPPFDSCLFSLAEWILDRRFHFSLSEKQGGSRGLR